MNDHDLVEALLEREPGAPAAVYDAHADRLYAYCWFQLRSRDAAQDALRDAFIVAEAYIGELRDPDRFGPWLYAIARLECARRPSSTDQAPDVSVASHDQDDVDQRIMAWQAVLALSPLSREILELRVRHQLSVPDLATVFGVPLADAQSALDLAHGELESALTAEILAHHGPYDCAERVGMLRERRGEFIHEANGRLLEHTQDCAVCGALRPRSVSATKVYGLLPDPELPPELRLRVTGCFLDPEFIDYRLLVSKRVTEFTSDGFPVQSTEAPEPPRTPHPERRVRFPRLRRANSLPAVQAQAQAAEDVPQAAGLRAQATRVFLVLAVVALLLGGGFASMHGFLDPERQSSDTVVEPRLSGASGPSQHSSSGQGESGELPVGIDGASVSATLPLGAQAPAVPPTVLQPPSKEPVLVNAPSGSPAEGQLVVSPFFLDLAGSTSGSIELQAYRRPLAWRATSRGPVRVYPSSGNLGAGQRATVRVYVDRRSKSRGSGTITFRPGGSRVNVTWRPDSPGSKPTPSPKPTGTGPGNPTTPPVTRRPSKTPAPSRPPSSSGGPSPEPQPSSDKSGPSPSTGSSPATISPTTGPMPSP
ncbi:sigma-70 family RNA polymerase sigma factor [Actinomadura decatromicini]|uniref:Sigma-70 family RNA polymerase sigma factor n=1 Tax=Actinomadura decatromicini TaxID=2604572 RepID=A0A5D3FSP1_9ACTN|nr:sigma-70 family RNA polymerase sigma factor [Actinomadura decatromicini]